MPPRSILHVDMDAFFASVEVREKPSLRGLPVLVAGAGKRGVVSAASYEARVFGCRSAQPTAVALRLCPRAVVISPRHGIYEEVSEQVFAIFERFTPLVEPLSIDEAFLDVTGSERLFGPPRAVAEAIRAAVSAETRLTCSVGISAVKFIAKIASGRNKPDGLTEVPPGGEHVFLDPLPIGELWGVGPKAKEALESRGIATIGDLRRRDARDLMRWFGESGLHFHQLAHAIDERAVEPVHERKSISHEDTYADDIAGRDVIERHLLDQATRVADRLTRKGLRGRKVHLKIRDGRFVTESRQTTLPRATAQAREIYRAACGLLDSVVLDGRGFRLTGVGVSDFVEPAEEEAQLDLFGAGGMKPTKEETHHQRGDALQGVLTAVRERFGAKGLYPADTDPHAPADTLGGKALAKKKADP
ncbi:MAG: DNA polymerase IV [Deltaproteobacteria bacterium]|nr:DNA polymerase IV [Deltaproteobacteria bacterium]